MERVSITKYLKEKNFFLKKFDKYRHELSKINQEEHDKINFLKEHGMITSSDEYFSEYTISVDEFIKRREKLKQKFGRYSDIYSCPYYCVAKNIEQLDKVFEGHTDGNYKYCKQYIEKWSGKKVQDECRNDIYGYFIGLGFTLDDIYFVIKDSKTKKEYLSLNIKEYNVNDHRSYCLVTNGKDYV